MVSRKNHILFIIIIVLVLSSAMVLGQNPIRPYFAQVFRDEFHETGEIYDEDIIGETVSTEIIPGIDMNEIRNNPPSVNPPMGRINILDKNADSNPSTKPDYSINPDPLITSEDVQEREFAHLLMQGLDDPQCSSGYIKALTPSGLVAYLKQKDMNCLYFLWDYNPDIQQTLNSQNMLAVLSEMNNTIPNYAGNNKDSLLQMMFFVRVAYYHRWYNPNAITFTQSVYDTTRKVYDGFSLSLYMNAFNQEAGEILNQWINGIDAADLFHNYLPQAKTILTDFVNDPKRKDSYIQRINVYSIAYAINRVNVNDPKTRSVYVNSIDQSFVDSIERVALYSGLMPAETWIIDNAIWSLGHITELSEHNSKGITALSKVLAFYPRLSEPYLWAVSAVDYFNKCSYIDQNGNYQKLCKADIKDEVIRLAFPNTYIYDDKAIIFRTPVAEKRIQDMYHGIKDVDQQFFRATETHTPVDKDPNSDITIIVYGSRNDYDVYHPFLFGLSTNNGGIYIEDWGTLFTYDRTPSQSYYSLEDLVRHEYTHFLVGRYLVKDMWGNNPIYNSDRMVWFDEGMAEFFTGSSSENGILPRKVLVEMINNDITKMKISEITKSTYSTPNFYRYSALFFNYLYENDFDTFKKLLDLVRNDDITGFDNIVAKISSDTAMETAYQNFLYNKTANIPNLINPSTSFIGYLNLNTGKIDVIENDLLSTNNIVSSECYISSVESLPRFTCMGQLSGQLANKEDYSAAWKAFDTQIIQVYNQVQKKQNNFKEMNCRISEIIFVQYNSNQVYPVTHYFCEGPLGMINSDVNTKTAQQVQKDFDSVPERVATQCTDKSNSVECKLIIYGSDFPIITQKSVAEEEISGIFRRMENTVFAINPQYYRDFDCQLDGNSTTIASGSNYRLEQKATCVCNF